MQASTTVCPACFRPVADEPCICGFVAREIESGLVLRPGTPLSSADGLLSYFVGMVLGAGSFGITYLAWDRHQYARVAIKEYLPRDLAGRASNGSSVRPHVDQDRSVFEHGLTRFRQEAEALRHFRHPNVVEVLAVFQANDTAYLVMPYYEGATLGTYLDRKGRMPPEVAVDLMVRVLQGLRHVHETTLDGRRWMHRDVKPDNILLRPDGGPVLLDFGAARTEVGERTRDVSVVLTAGYAPFEQYFARGASQGPWLDVYAAAATLYHAIAGEAPVSSIERHEALNDKQPDPLVPPDRIVPGVPRTLSRAIVKGLTMKYSERPKDAHEFQVLLTAVEFERPIPAGQQPAKRIPSERQHATPSVQEPAPPEPGPSPAPLPGPVPWTFGVAVVVLLIVLLMLAAFANAEPLVGAPLSANPTERGS
jgi:serine/threonine protein kinase